MSRAKYSPLGQRFGRLLVQRSAGSDRNRCSMWACVCDCGNRVVVYGSDLRKGHTQSCGCLQRDRTSQANKTHGQSVIKTSEYRAWASCIQRCTNPKNKNYARYGGRGITVCDRWRTFENFLADMGKRPSTKHTLDRIDNDGNYEPGNCRWATWTQQANNKSIRLFEGKTQKEWALELGITQSAVCQRLKKWGSVTRKPRRFT